ncbi:type II toxin-antitoxin system RatA family toxin [Bordetella sputigena]
MFELVAGVEHYPEFMPWCGGAEVLSRDEQGMQASIVISFAGIKQRFTTRNTHQFPHRIDLELVDGPFSMLVGHWEFQALAADACKVLFTMEYEFSNRALELVVGPVFNRIATSFIDSFTKRAQAVYGE